MAAKDNLSNSQFEPEPYTFRYARRRGSAPNLGSTYGQDIEPHGRYVTQADPNGNYPEDLYETGELTFQRPLRIPFGGGYGEPDNWKSALSQQHGGATGRRLSEAVRKSGHDGIITHDDYGTSEIVDLTNLRPGK